MGIYTDIQNDIGEALDNDLSDTAQTLIYVEVTASEYNPTSGKEYKVTNNVSCRGVVQPVDTSHIDGETVLIDDRQFLILDSEIDATPEVGRVLQYDGEDYNINQVLRDPANSTWTIIARAV